MAGSLSLPTLVQKVILDAKGVSAGAKQAEQSLSRAGTASGRFGESVDDSGKKARLAGLAIAASATAVLFAIHKAVQGAAEYASGIRKIQAASDASAEDASRLVFVLERFGISAESVIRPLINLSRNIEAGGGKLRDFFTAAELARFKTQPLLQTILELNDKYHELNTATERNAFLNAVAGRGAVGLRRLFSASREEIAQLAADAERFGLVLTQDNLDAFKKWSDGQREMEQAAKGLQIQIAQGTVPVMTALTKGATNVILALRQFSPVVANIALVVGLAAVGLVTFGEGIIAAVNVIRLLGAGIRTATIHLATHIALQAIARGSSFALAAALAAVQVALVGIGAAAGAFIVGNLISDFIRAKGEAKEFAETIAGGSGSVETQLDRLRRKQKELEDQGLGNRTFEFDNPFSESERDRARANLDAVKAKIKELEAAKKALGTATAPTDEGIAQLDQQVTDAIETLGEYEAAHSKTTAAEDAFRNAVAETGAASLQSAAAREALIRAILEEQNATQGVTLDEEELTRRRLAAIQAVQQLADAEVEATERRIEANARLIVSFNQIEQGGVTTGDERKRLLEERERAVDGLRDAYDQLRDAEERVEENRRFITRTPERERELRDAQEDVEDAKRAIREAKEEIGAVNEEIAAGQRGALATLLDTTAKNTETFNQFFDDINTLAASGNKALAAQLLALGPEAAAAAREAVEKLGSPEGLGAANKIAQEAIEAAKRTADASLDEWVKNFQGKGQNAGMALGEGVSQGLQTWLAEGGWARILDALPLPWPLELAARDAFTPQRQHQGGLIRRFHRGGEVPALLEPGEFVIRRTAVRAIGVDILNRLNRFHEGGPVGSVTHQEFNSRGGDVNVGTVMAHDYDAFKRQMEREQRLAQLTNGI